MQELNFFTAMVLFLGVPALISFASAIAQEVADTRRINRSKPSWSTEHRSNKPNFKKRADADFASDYEEEIPDFDSIEEFKSETTDTLAEIVPEKHEKVTETFEHSIPTSDMEQEIEELLAATAVFDETENGAEYEMPSDKDAPSNNEGEWQQETIESVLGENYISVRNTWGEKVADMISATPDFGLDTGLTYVMFGKILKTSEGHFLDCFGETIKIKGVSNLKENSDEHYLIQGNFVTAELFQVVETIPAKEVSKGKEFDVLNISIA